MKGKKRKAEAEPVKVEYEMIEVEYSKPFAAVEGMTKANARDVFKLLQELTPWFLPTAKRILNKHPKLKYMLSGAEKELFLKTLEENHRRLGTPQWFDLDCATLFPHIQEVIDYDPKANGKFYHTEKKTKVNEDGIGDSSNRYKRYIDPKPMAEYRNAVYGNIRRSDMR